MKTSKSVKTTVDSYGHRLKAFSLRMEKKLREGLEKEARKNSRTLTAEINYRLERSLWAQENKVGQLDEMKSQIAELHDKLDKLSGRF